jgi:mannose-6-phosphate isomerase-like protein (cupin superfamily)
VKGAGVIAHNLQPYRNTRDDLPFQFLGAPTLLRATAETTNGAFGLIEHSMMPPGFGSPYHVHRREDESFYVIQGHVAFVCDGKWLTAGSGDFVFGPRNIPHGFKVTGTAPAQMLVLVSPGGFERFIKDLGEPVGRPPSLPDIARLEAVAANYGVEILGALPEEPR